MSLLMQKLFRQLHEEQPGEGGAGGGGGASDDAVIQREQELEASRRGWVPKHKFKGPETQWKDAATFLRDGEKINRNLQNELATVRKELEDFKGTAKQFAEFQQRQIEQRDGEIAGLIKKLKTEHREAIREGDDATADAIEERIDLLQEERTTTKKQLESAKQTQTERNPNDDGMGVDEHGNTKNPVILEWVASGNDWFQKSKPMRDYAFAIANELLQSGETRRGRPFLDSISEKMKEAFPLQLGEGRGDPTRRGSLSESGSSSSGSGGHTKADLPEEDRQLMERGIREGWIKEETFLKNYFSDTPRIHRTASGKK
jgi:hypothetical protein